jgi:hypothetical protein
MLSGCGVLDIKLKASNLPLMTAVNERRKSARYQVRAPVTFRAESTAHSARHGAGFVKNLSTEGIYVICPAGLSIGDRIELEVLLPPLRGMEGELALRSSGLVVRAEHSIGFAAAAEFSFHRWEDIGSEDR